MKSYQTVKDWLLFLRENDFEKYEHFKDFVEYIEIGAHLSIEALQEQENYIQKLSEANEKLMVQVSIANGIYHE